MFGYGGRILTVDVTSGDQRVEEFDAGFARAYLGGNGFAAKLCYDRIPPGIDAFDPRNLVVFGTGPITDSVIPGNNRNCVAGKSPLNDLFFDSTFGGRFAGTQRHTGFDAIVITGAAAEPVYVLVDEQGARLQPARDLWGKPTLQTARAILDREGWESDVVSIGPAGERRARIAALAHYWKNREAFGARGGLAAVLGSKNVKAVVVRGGQKAQFARPDDLKALVNETREALKKGTYNLHVYGTPNLVKGINAIGGLGFFNNRLEHSPDAEQVGGERYKLEFHKKDTTCNKCPVACGKTFEVKAGEYAGTVWKMPEYETIYAFGPMLGNLDPASLIKAEELCDQLGLDTISMGVTIAFVLECLERGFLTEREVGVPVGWGNHQAVHRLVEMTARRDGEEYVLNGTKMFITNGSIADLVFIAARTDSTAKGSRGISIFAVEKDTPGFKASRALEKMGWHSSNTAELVLEDVRVPHENLIGEENQGFYYIMSNFQNERLAIMGQALGEAQRALELTVDHVKNRSAFGGPLWNKQTIRQRLALRQAEIDAGRQLTYHAAWLTEQGEDAVREVSEVKALVGEMVNRVLYDCVQFHGGMGFIAETAVERLYRDVRIASIGGGATEVMLDEVAKRL